MIRFVMISLLLIGVALSQKTQDLAAYLNLSSALEPLLLASLTTFTVPMPITVSTHLTLIGQQMTRIECASSCFTMDQFNLTLTNLEIVFGNSATTSGSLITVPPVRPMADVFASLSLNDCKVRFQAPNSFACPLIAFESGARMRDVFVNQTELVVHTMIEEKAAMATPASGASGGGASGGGQPTIPPVSAVSTFTLTSLRFQSSHVVCESNRARCINVSNGVSLVLRFSTVSFSAAANVRDNVRHAIWFDGGSRPNSQVILKFLTLDGETQETAERVFLTRVVEIEMGNITLNGAAKLAVEQADLVSLSSSTLNATIANNTLRFVDVETLSVDGVDVFNRELNSSCMPLPQISITAALRDDFVNLTKIRVSGVFCNSTMTADTGVVSVSGVKQLHIEQSSFHNMSNARAVIIKSAASVRVLESTFVNAILSQSGFLHVSGRADVANPQLRVERSSFVNLTTDSGAAIDARNTSVDINSVTFNDNKQRVSNVSQIAGGASLNIENLKSSGVGNVVVEDVVFTNIVGKFVVVMNISSLAQPQVHMKRVQFDNNRVTAAVCSLAGVTHVLIEDFVMYSNLATSGLLMTGPSKIGGTFTRVCICGNSPFTVGSQCPSGTMLAGNNVFVQDSTVNMCSLTSAPCGEKVTCSLPPTTTTINSGNNSTTTTSTTTTITANTSGTLTGTLSTNSMQEMTSETKTTSTTALTSTSGSLVESTDSSGSTMTTMTNNVVDVPFASGSENTVHSSESATTGVGVASIIDSAPVLGGIIGGVLGCIVLILIGVVIALVLMKRRARASTGEETPTQMQQTAGSGTGTGTPFTASSYASIQSVLPSHYGESKFSDLN